MKRLSKIIIEHRNGKYVSLLNNILIFVCGSALSKIIQIFLMPLYTAFMSTAGYGTGELINSIAEFLLPIVTICMYQACFRYSVNSNYKQETILAVTMRVYCISLIVGGAVTYILHRFFHVEYVRHLFFLLYAYALNRILGYYVRGKGKSLVFALSGVINTISLFALTVLFLVNLKLDARGYLLSIALSYIISSLVLFLGGQILYDIKHGIYDTNCFKDLVSFSYPLVIYSIGYWFTTISGRYILLWFSDASTVGIYVAAIKISAAINMIQQSVQPAIEFNANKEYSSVKKEIYYSELFEIFSSLYFVMGAVIMAVKPVISDILLKGNFNYASIYIPSVVFASVLQCLSALYGTMYSVYKITSRKIPYVCICALINVVSGVLLVPKIGIWGICIASSLGFFFQLIYAMIDIRKICNISIKWKKSIYNLILLFIIMLITSRSQRYSPFSFILLLSIILYNLIGFKDKMEALKI